MPTLDLSFSSCEKIGLFGLEFAGNRSTSVSASCGGKERAVFMTISAVNGLTILHRRPFEPALVLCLANRSQKMRPHIVCIVDGVEHQLPNQEEILPLRKQSEK